VSASILFGDNAPVELSEWNLAERFGWGVEYVRQLPIIDVWELMQVDDGRKKARSEGKQEPWENR
jgi:hypothetical protein